MSEQTENQRITGEIIDAIVEYDAWRDNLHPNDLPLAKARIMKALEDKDASLSALRKERDFLRKEIKDCISWLGEVEASNIRFVSIGAKAQRLRFERCLTPRQEERPDANS